MTAGHLHRRTAAAGLTVFTLAALLSGCTAGAPAEPDASAQPTVAAQPTSPAPAATSTAASSSAAGPVWTALKDSVPYKGLKAEQQSKVSALEAMDQATFEKQGRDDQLAYGAFLREVYQDDAIAGTAATAPDIALQAARKVSSKDTGTQIIADELLKSATARWSVELDPDDTKTTPAPSDGNYTKMAPSRVSPLYPEAYAEASAPPELTQKTVLSGLSDQQRMSIVDESNNFIPYDGSMEQLEFKILQMQSTETQARNQFYFAYTPFSDIHGAKDGVWILMLDAQEGQEKWIPDLSVID